MVNHMKLIKGKRGIDGTDKSVLERILDRSEQLLDLVFFILSIILHFVSDCIVVLDKPIGPVL